MTKEGTPGNAGEQAPRTEARLRVVGDIAASEAPSPRERIKGALDDPEVQSAVEGLIKLLNDGHNLSAEEEREVIGRLIMRLRTPRG